eukprot:Amastigsp_a846565_10.p2 type:complete len:146 gc:universal Amastigsp_a846565_10:936-499(-)
MADAMCFAPSSAIALRLSESSSSDALAMSPRATQRAPSQPRLLNPRKSARRASRSAPAPNALSAPRFEISLASTWRVARVVLERSAAMSAAKPSSPIAFSRTSRYSSRSFDSSAAARAAAPPGPIAFWRRFSVTRVEFEPSPRLS